MSMHTYRPVSAPWRSMLGLRLRRRFEVVCTATSTVADAPPTVAEHYTTGRHVGGRTWEIRCPECRILAHSDYR